MTMSGNKSLPPEELTTGKRRRPRSLSLPDTMLADTPDEDPPAGYTLAMTTNEKGEKVPRVPRQFVRLKG